MAAGEYDITVEQGATFSRVLTWKNSSGTAYNLTGYTARMKAKANYSSANAIVELTTENGRIALGGAAGTVTLTISAADTAALSATTGVYDLELISGGGAVTRLVQGKFTVSPEVTK